jgi:predicted alpha/beta hydrolase
MGFGAAAIHGWLRLYSIASLVTSVVAGVVSFLAAPYAPTPMLGIGERISIGAFLLWVAVLAVALWRAPVGAPDPQH